MIVVQLNNNSYICSMEKKRKIRTEIDKALKIKEEYYADKQSSNSRL